MIIVVFVRRVMMMCQKKKKEKYDGREKFHDMTCTGSSKEKSNK